MGMSEFYGNADDAKSTALLHHALDAGMNFFDTADMYGPWTNERLIGAALRDRRDEAVIATKFGVMRGEDRGFLGINGTPEYVRSACDASLDRLGIDTIDLYVGDRRHAAAVNQAPAPAGGPPSAHPGAEQRIGRGLRGRVQQPLAVLPRVLPRVHPRVWSGPQRLPASVAPL